MVLDLELIIHEPHDGRSFLNYWNNSNGNDVCCRIVNGKLFLTEYDAEGKELPPSEISFEKFLTLVQKSANS